MLLYHLSGGRWGCPGRHLMAKHPFGNSKRVNYLNHSLAICQFKERVKPKREQILFLKVVSTHLPSWVFKSSPEIKVFQEHAVVQYIYCNLFILFQHCIRDLVSSVAKQNDIPLNKENLDMFVLMVLHEACSPIPSSTAQIAVQLLFGRANLVRKPHGTWSFYFHCIFVKVFGKERT